MSIPISSIVAVQPGILSAGGENLTLSGLFLTQSTLMPTLQVLSFVNAASVSSFFGPSSLEASVAPTYFLGYDNSSARPAAMLFAPYNAAARAGWVQSGNLAYTVAQWEAISGSLYVTVDGYVFNAPAINLSSAGSSPDAAAAYIQSALVAEVTSPPSAPTRPTVTWNAVQGVLVITSGTTGVTSSVSFATGTAAAVLGLTSATGATISAGDTADTPSSCMNKAIAATTNWSTFVPLIEPSTANKTAFAQWSNAQNDEYLYIAWDSDAQASVQNSHSCFGYLAKQAAYNGVVCLSGDPALAILEDVTLESIVLDVAVFLSGAIASINFAQANGRVTLAFKSQTGLQPTCANAQIAANLLANGYSYYGSYATANQGFNFLYNGQLPGEWLWVDTYVNQIQLNSQFQLALIGLLTAVGSIPYNAPGYALVRSTLAGPINDALNFGSIQTGVVLSPAQAAEVNLAAGQNVASTIQTQGYYLQIVDPGAPARALRSTPIINFWYTDGSAIQELSLDSIDIL